MFPKSPIKVRWVYRFVGDYFDQKHISDFIGFFGANYGNLLGNKWFFDNFRTLFLNLVNFLFKISVVRALSWPCVEDGGDRGFSDFSFLLNKKVLVSFEFGQSQLNSKIGFVLCLPVGSSDATREDRRRYKRLTLAPYKVSTEAAYTRQIQGGRMDRKNAEEKKNILLLYRAQ